MNKKTIRFAGWALGLSMAVAGIGMVVGASYVENSEPTIVKAVESIDGSFDLSSSLPSGLTSSVTLSKDKTGRGMGKAGASFTLKTSAAYENVVKIVVNAATNYTSYTKHSISATVGGSAFGSSAPFSAKASTDYEISGPKTSGAVVVTLNNSATTTSKNTIWVKSITIYTEKTIEVVGVELNETSINLVKDSQQQLIATVTPENATNKNVTWASDNKTVATVSDGLVTAISAGTATITVTTEDGSKQASCKVTVSDSAIAVAGVSLNESSTSICVGDTYTLIATVDPAEATNKNVTWSSSNEKVATVSDGVVTGITEGTATITVTTEDGSKTATCQVTVNNVSVTSVALNQTEGTIFIGKTLTLSATISPENATNKNVTWSSSKEAVASVSNGVVTALSVGTTDITVTTEDGSKTATCKITVEEPLVYEKSTSMNQIWNGQKFLLGNEGGTVISKIYGSQNGTSDNNIKGVSVSSASGRIDEAEANKGVVYTLNEVVYDSNADGEADAKAYTLFDGTYYLYTSATKDNQLKGKTDVDDACYWNVSFENSVLSVTSVNNTSRGVMQFNANNTPPIFNCYDSAKMSDVSFFVLDSNDTGESAAKAFIDTYMHMDVSGDGNGMTGDLSCKGWYLPAKIAWNSLSDDAKSKVGIEVKERLAAWARANGESFDSSTGLFGAMGVNGFGLHANSDSTIPWIVAVTSVGVASIGAFAFLRKRKNED